MGVLFVEQGKFRFDPTEVPTDIQPYLDLLVRTGDQAFEMTDPNDSEPCRNETEDDLIRRVLDSDAEIIKDLTRIADVIVEAGQNAREHPLANGVYYREYIMGKRREPLRQVYPEKRDMDDISKASIRLQQTHSVHGTWQDSRVFHKVAVSAINDQERLDSIMHDEGVCYPLKQAFHERDVERNNPLYIPLRTKEEYLDKERIIFEQTCEHFATDQNERTIVVYG